MTMPDIRRGEQVSALTRAYLDSKEALLKAAKSWREANDIPFMHKELTEGEQRRRFEAMTVEELDALIAQHGRDAVERMIAKMMGARGAQGAR